MVIEELLWLCWTWLIIMNIVQFQCFQRTQNRLFRFVVFFLSLSFLHVSLSLVHHLGVFICLISTPFYSLWPIQWLFISFHFISNCFIWMRRTTEEKHFYSEQQYLLCASFSTFTLTHKHKRIYNIYTYRVHKDSAQLALLLSSFSRSVSFTIHKD